MTYTNIINQNLEVDFEKPRWENYAKIQGVKQLNIPEELETITLKFEIKWKK